MDSKDSRIKVYDPQRWTREFLPQERLQSLLRQDFTHFFIVRVEEMYRHLRRAVPASRSLTHSGLYLTEGEAAMKIGAEVYRIQAGQMLFVPAGQVFSFGKNDVNCGFLFNFHDDFFYGMNGRSGFQKPFEFLKVWGNPRIVPDAETSGFVRNLLERLWTEYSRQGLQNPDLIHAYLTALLIEVSRAYHPVSPSGRTTAVMLTNRFRELVFTQARTRHLVSDYAAQLGVTPNHLNKTVRSVTGKSPTRWIDEAILAEAKVLLSQSDFSVGAIASEVGLSDSSYFTRLFRKYEGLTPTAFRKRIEMS
ncbi:AraC family transcriptional regulator [Larkinella soli]|uniref:AraC family transcriptional regulator n=1 Tax=Larkinella soli TaxID=1770527 RepID=UPI000FFC2CBF|nr:AraC family transcriptional regulator [Larkinella soli]